MRHRRGGLVVGHDDDHVRRVRGPVGRGAGGPARRRRQAATSAATAAATAAARSCGPRLPIATTTPGTAGWIAIAAARSTFRRPCRRSRASRIIGDPLLRRIRMPADLDAVTTVGDEADPEAVGLSRGDRRGHLGLGARPLPQRGPPRAHALPAARRAGGDRPRDRPRPRQRAGRRRGRAEGARHARHPVLRLLHLQGGDGDARPHARRARRAGARRPGRPAHPRVLPPRQGRDHDRARARAPRRSGLAAAARRSTSTCSATASAWSS